MDETRLYVEKDVADILLQKMDKEPSLSYKRMEQFMLALALGLECGVRTPLKNRKDLIRQTSCSSNDISMLRSVALYDLKKEGRENLITDDTIVFSIAQEYANTGFHIIADELIPDFNDYDEETFYMQLIDKADGLFESLNERE